MNVDSNEARIISTDKKNGTQLTGMIRVGGRCMITMYTDLVPETTKVMREATEEEAKALLPSLLERILFEYNGKPPQDTEMVEDALRELNSQLREKLVDTKLLSIEQWNSDIAPKLSRMAMALEGSTITARTYRLPENYFDEDQS